MTGEVALIIGREGLVRPLVVGKGPAATRRAVKFLEEIYPDLCEFSDRVAARFAAKNEAVVVSRHHPAGPTVLS